MRSFITFITDFGYTDHFVGVMKGVILGINPAVRIIDISHQIDSQDIREAAFVLKLAYRYFPKNTIHVVVVDPGVGSGRRPIVVVTPDYYFIGPDNGVFSYIYKEEGSIKVVEISAEHYYLQSPGSTFHGRDIFAPVAGWLSRGIEANNFGLEMEDFARLEPSEPEIKEGLIVGRIIHIDKFGNLITDIEKHHIEELIKKTGKKQVEVKVKDLVIPNLSKYYSQIGRGLPGALINSDGYLEIYCYLGSTRELLKVAKGEEVGVIAE